MPPKDLVAITPADLEAAIIKLPPHWIIWEGFVLTYYKIHDHVLDGRMRLFAPKWDSPYGWIL